MVQLPVKDSVARETSALRSAQTTRTYATIPSRRFMIFLRYWAYLCRLLFGFQNTCVLQCDQFVESKVFEAVTAGGGDEFGGDALNFCGDGFFGVHFEARVFQFLYVGRRDALNLHADERVGVEILAGGSPHLFDILRRDALNLHGNEIIGINLEAHFAHLLDVLRCDALDFHAHEVVGISLETEVVHLLYIVRRAPLDLHAYDGVGIEVLPGGGTHFSHVIGRDTLDFHPDQFVRIGLHAKFLHGAHVLGGYSLDFQAD